MRKGEGVRFWVYEGDAFEEKGGHCTVFLVGDILVARERIQEIGRAHV